MGLGLAPQVTTNLITKAVLMGGVIGCAVLAVDSRPYNARMY
ncbi:MULTISPECIES: hypothetical protein [unclassified Nocardia]|nr:MULTISPECIES: hypothetical protein [unclassified Nocardia]